MRAVQSESETKFSRTRRIAITAFRPLLSIGLVATGGLITIESVLTTPELKASGIILMLLGLLVSPPLGN